MGKNQQPVVTIIGRPNVGKSTFFNRLYGQRKAIESALPKTTIDKIYGEVEWSGKTFLLIDTAGIYRINNNDKLQKRIINNMESAIEESDLVLFLVDINDIHSFDREIAKKLHKIGKKNILVANKADNNKREIISQEILSLGLGEPTFISAISGRGVGDLLDLITDNLPKFEKNEKQENNIINVALIGRPNVGKSTILNSIVDKKRAIVSEIPGTTRDTNDEIIKADGTEFKIMDTAGIRRRGKINHEIEKYSIIRSLKAIKESDIAVLIIDAIEGITNQDTHIAGTAKDMGKSMIVVINKVDIWDHLSEGEQNKRRSWLIGMLQKDLAFLPYVPIIFASGLKKTNIKKIFSQAKEIYQERQIFIEQCETKKIISAAKDNNQQFPNYDNFYQENSNPPVLKLVGKNKKRVHFSHIRYLENFIRNYCPFRGTPIFIDLVENK
jgi:GTPase